MLLMMTQRGVGAPEAAGDVKGDVAAVELLQVTFEQSVDEPPVTAEHKRRPDVDQRQHWPTATAAAAASLRDPLYQHRAAASNASPSGGCNLCANSRQHSVHAEACELGPRTAGAISQSSSAPGFSFADEGPTNTTRSASSLSCQLAPAPPAKMIHQLLRPEPSHSRSPIDDSKGDVEEEASQEDLKARMHGAAKSHVWKARCPWIVRSSRRAAKLWGHSRSVPVQQKHRESVDVDIDRYKQGTTCPKSYFKRVRQFVRSLRSRRVRTTLTEKLEGDKIDHGENCFVEMPEAPPPSDIDLQRASDILSFCLDHYMTLHLAFNNMAWLDSKPHSKDSANNIALDSVNQSEFISFLALHHYFDRCSTLQGSHPEQPVMQLVAAEQPIQNERRGGEAEWRALCAVLLRRAAARQESGKTCSGAVPNDRAKMRMSRKDFERFADLLWKERAFTNIVEELAGPLTRSVQNRAWRILAALSGRDRPKATAKLIAAFELGCELEPRLLANALFWEVFPTVAGGGLAECGGRDGWSEACFGSRPCLRGRAEAEGLKRYIRALEELRNGQAMQGDGFDSDGLDAIKLLLRGWAVLRDLVKTLTAVESGCAAGVEVDEHSVSSMVAHAGDGNKIPRDSKAVARLRLFRGIQDEIRPLTSARWNPVTLEDRFKLYSTSLWSVLHPRCLLQTVFRGAELLDLHDLSLLLEEVWRTFDELRAMEFLYEDAQVESQHVLPQLTKLWPALFIWPPEQASDVAIQERLQTTVRALKGLDKMVSRAPGLAFCAALHGATVLVAVAETWLSEAVKLVENPMLRAGVKDFYDSKMEPLVSQILSRVAPYVEDICASPCGFRIEQMRHSIRSSAASSVPVVRKIGAGGMAGDGSDGTIEDETSARASLVAAVEEAWRGQLSFSKSKGLLGHIQRGRS